MITTILLWIWIVFGTIICIVVCGCSFTYTFPNDTNIYIVGIGDIVVNVLVWIGLWLLFCGWPLANHFGYY